ncbi:tungsten ABC transporter substrate-binding protein [Amylibacter ulvae]|uniref:Tungsten ABC transporter substrate-binding protein n=1 Tax=Paramylibacter ulvae TaxID=1651968 RepID=A0ABQ3D281_9RHOB|nr:substrate-binding domain-containing protein [Amylibacter ulvae]GHA52271.1 tungsten ABC transporter substrate-binding protein [Amylibacter ulvae]
MRPFIAALTIAISTASMAMADFITVASTTSTQNSGLYDQILPQFTAQTGIEVRVVAVGTGQAIRIAQNGDADVLLVHHRASEDAFVAEGYAKQRFDVMYNDFIIVGPKTDFAPSSLDELLNHFVKTGDQTFISRGDDSGTHKRERELWAKYAESMPAGDWYREIGSGMGATLNMASAINGFTLTDRGTWLSFGNKGDLGIIWQQDKDLRNPYGVMVVDSDRFPHVKSDLAIQFAQWLISDTGQTAIGDVRVAGKQLFCPNANQQSEQEQTPDDACPAQ